MAKGWRGADTADEVRAAILGDVPHGSSRERVAAWLAAEGIEYADRGDEYAFRLKGPSRGLFVGVTWLVSLSFDGDALAGVEVSEGKTGP